MLSLILIGAVSGAVGFTAAKNKASLLLAVAVSVAVSLGLNLVIRII